MVIFQRTSEIIAALITLAFVAGLVSLSNGAQAKQFFPFSYGAASFASGLVLGAVATSAATTSTCSYVDRSVVDRFGNEYFRRIRVCD